MKLLCTEQENLARKGAKTLRKKNFAPLRLCVNLFFLLLLTACATSKTAVLPTPISLAVLPTEEEREAETAVTASPIPNTPFPSSLLEATATSKAAAATPTTTQTFTPVPHTPEGTGISPSQAEQRFVPDSGPAAETTLRPPPLPVPLSLHPDDHYWLLRPIPSGKRNFDLEWYPYGTDVLLPDQPPYRIHHGLDFPNEQGTPVLAAGSGTVIHAGPFPSPRNGVNYYGNTVVIRHDWQWQGQDVYTLYAHTLELFVEVGDYVAQGQLIAGVGSSGEVTSSHLHLEVRVGNNNYNNTQNPTLWLAPFEGYGTLAGRFVDRNGRFITDATLILTRDDGTSPPRRQRTYSPNMPNDAVWQENFVMGDLPAGRYTLLLTVNDINYRRRVEILPGRTSFELISTQFSFSPTATPTITPLPSPTPITPTLTITTTATSIP